MFVVTAQKPSSLKHRIRVSKKINGTSLLKTVKEEEFDSLIDLAIELHRLYLEERNSVRDEIFFDLVGADIQIKDTYDYIYGNDI